MFYSLKLNNLLLKKITLVLLIVDLILLTFVLLGFRFTSVLLQSVISTLFISSFPVIFALSVFQWEVSKTILKIIKLLLVSILSLLFLIIFLFSFLDVSNTYRSGYDASFVPIQTIDVNSKKIVTYRTDGGATTDFGVRIQKESQHILGIKRIELISEHYHVKDIRLEYRGNNQLEIISITPTSNEYSPSLPKIGEKIEL